jgi:hypothetical protein
MGVKVCAHNPDMAYVMKQEIATISAIGEHLLYE